MNSNRIELIHCNQEVLDIILQGDASISENMKLAVPKDWSTFGPQSFEYTLSQIKEKPQDEEWWMYLAVLTASQTLVGSGGYKGAPNREGEVEIGYEVASVFRGKGIATDMCGLFVKKAFAIKGIKKVIAHTLNEENASVSVLRKNKFSFVGEVNDKEDGLIWKWELNRFNAK